jgi:hypothetical protein
MGWSSGVGVAGAGARGAVIARLQCHEPSARRPGPLPRPAPRPRWRRESPISPDGIVVRTHSNYATGARSPRHRPWARPDADSCPGVCCPGARGPHEMFNMRSALVSGWYTRYTGPASGYAAGPGRRQLPIQGLCKVLNVSCVICSSWSLMRFLPISIPRLQYCGAPADMGQWVVSVSDTRKFL